MSDETTAIDEATVTEDAMRADGGSMTNDELGITNDEVSQAGEKLVPVSESIRYRKRAQAAEQRLVELQEQLEQARADLEESRQTLDAVEQRQRIDHLLIEADAIDLEAARLLTEIAVASDEEPDLAEAVEQLKARKPYLFRRDGRGAGGMSARPRGGPGGLDDAARIASQSGDRRDLLRYLRLRRSGS